MSSSDPNANPGVNGPNTNPGIDPNATSGAAAPASTTTTTSTKMPDFSSDKQSIGEILNKDSVKGMDLSANLDGLIENMVAITCQHKVSGQESNVLNNMEKSLYSFTAVKLTNVDSNEIDVLNKFPDTTNAKCQVLDSKNNKNVTEISEQDAKNKNAQLFTLIKSAISSDTDISTGVVLDSKRTELTTYNTVLKQLSGGVDIKFAAAMNSTTQVVFGVEYENDVVKRVVGRIQSVGIPGGSVQTGDFSMDLDGEKYVITAGKDAGITVKTILKKILNTKKPIEMKVEETQPAEDQGQAGQGQVQAGQVQAGQGQTSSTGGKSKRRRHKKKGTRKHKPKRTMKKRKSSRRRSSKK